MKYRITTRFGDLDSYHSQPHTGYDFAMKTGEPLRAIANGKIHYEDYGDQNAGKTVFITDEKGHTFIYGHCSRFGEFKEGQEVHIGDIVSYAGNTGNSFGSHLHFGLKEHGHFVDGAPYISKIEHMNDKGFHQHVQELSDSKISLDDGIHSQVNIYASLLHNLNLDFIHDLFNLF